MPAVWSCILVLMVALMQPRARSALQSKRMGFEDHSKSIGELSNSDPSFQRQEVVMKDLFESKLNVEKLIDESVRNREHKRDHGITGLPSNLLYVVSLLGSTALLTAQLQDSLMNLELMQDWRYFWPMIGSVYVANSVFPETKLAVRFRQLLSQDEVTTTSGTSWFNEGLPALAGAGLVVGGLADAFLPVYVTGPNLVTAAGLGPDCAAFLGVWTLMQFSKLPSSTTKHSPTSMELGRFFSQAFLLAQLTILGAPSAYDAASTTIL